MNIPRRPCHPHRLHRPCRLHLPRGSSRPRWQFFMRCLHCPRRRAPSALIVTSVQCGSSASVVMFSLLVPSQKFPFSAHISPSKEEPHSNPSAAFPATLPHHIHLTRFQHRSVHFLHTCSPDEPPIICSESARLHNTPLLTCSPELSRSDALVYTVFILQFIQALCIFFQLHVMLLLCRRKHLRLI